MQRQSAITWVHLTLCVFVAMIGGLLLGIFIDRVALLSKRSLDYEVNTEFLPEVMQMLDQYKRQNVIRHSRVKLIDPYCLDVGIVAQRAKVEYGFALLPEEFAIFYAKIEGISVTRLEGRYAFVTISVRTDRIAPD